MYSSFSIPTEMTKKCLYHFQTIVTSDMPRKWYKPQVKYPVKLNNGKESRSLFTF